MPTRSQGRSKRTSCTISSVWVTFQCGGVSAARSGIVSCGNRISRRYRTKREASDSAVINSSQNRCSGYCWRRLRRNIGTKANATQPSDYWRTLNQGRLVFNHFDLAAMYKYFVLAKELVAASTEPLILSLLSNPRVKTTDTSFSRKLSGSPGTKSSGRAECSILCCASHYPGD